MSPPETVRSDTYGRNLADTQQRGSLDLPDFIIGMFLIQSCMANSKLQLPATLPAGIYEQASGGRAPPNAPSSPLARQNTGPQSPIRPQYTGGALQPQRTGQGAQIMPQATPPRQGSMNTGPAFAGASAFGQSRPSQAWDVTPEAKSTSDRFFAQLDQQNRGIIEGDVAVPFMLQSQLDEGTLATIWFVLPYIISQNDTDSQGPIGYYARRQTKPRHVRRGNASDQSEASRQGATGQSA